LRRISSPTLVACATAAIGLIGVISALTPEIAWRFRIVRGILPDGWPSAARTLTLALSFGLLWIARGLARRKRRAWQLAVAIVIASAVAHLAKGLDFEEATGSLLVLVVLLRTRRKFVAPGDASAVWPLLQVVIALGVAVAIVTLHDYVLSYPDRIDDALLMVICVLGLRALVLWLRPIAERVRHVPDDRRRAEELVRERGSDSLAYFALRRDKSTFFSPTRRSFLAYRVIGGTAIITGDPIGEPEERLELMAEFRRVARTMGWRVAIAGAGEEALVDYDELGFRSIYLGDEAYVRPEEFSLEGRPIRKVRQSVTRLEKAGYRAEIVSPGELSPEVRDEIRSVSEEWRGNWPERGFTMAMDALFAYSDTLLAIAYGPDDRIGGFIQLVPAPACRAYSLASMRRRRETPNGLMEFLIVETIAWGREHDVSEVSLNFSVFAEYLRADHGLFRALLLKFDRLFQLERLHSFNRKFFPRWRRRYFCFERWTDLPPAGLAYLQAESLLTPPGPWAARSTDLAAS
jgi:lysyl-tRNA synthetase, class II